MLYEVITYSGAGAIREVITEARGRGIKVVICEAEPGVVSRQNLYGLQAQVDGAYDSVEDVIAAYDGRAMASGTMATAAASVGSRRCRASERRATRSCR